MWIKHPFFKYLTAFILVLLALHLLSKVDFIVDPIRRFIMTLFFPLLISGFLYYVLKPVVHFLSKSKYIPRRVAILFVLLMYIGYLIIGLDYALLLAFFVVVLTAVVPILGPALGVLPAILVGLMMEPFMVVKILILLVIVQETEGSLVSPLVIGNKLEIHPLTVMLLLLVAGSLYGFIGILIAIPAYSVLKVTIKNFYGFYMLRNA